MTEKVAHHFAAPTNVVFTVLADPERAARWLAGAQQPRSYRLSVVPADLSVRWAPSTPDAGWSGRALVRDAIGGGSVVYLEVTATGTAGQPSLAEALDRLAAEVASV
jgi:uncharacterized protein YndB with AHSA1/START domain